MRYQDVKKMERQEVAYSLLLFRMAFYKQELEKVTLYRKKNRSGRLISSIVCYMTDSNNNVHSEKYKLFDEDYLWFTCALQQDFPELPFEDLTDEQDKRCLSDKEN